MYVANRLYLTKVGGIGIYFKIFFLEACSSVGEHLLDVQGVRSSTLLTPTIVMATGEA
ncbi:hypothetical protein DSUL_100090 [Desulfovibrionales bacterium]